MRRDRDPSSRPKLLCTNEPSAEDVCPRCGYFGQRIPPDFAGEYARSSIPRDVDIFRGTNQPDLIFATERLVEACAELDITGFQASVVKLV